MIPHTDENLSSTGRPEFHVYQERDHRWRWRLKNARNQSVAQSADGFSTRTAAEENIDAVRELAPGARVITVD